MNAGLKALLIRQLLKGRPVVNQLGSLVNSKVLHQPESVPISRSDLARLIDHTILRPDAGLQEVRTVCDEARKHRFAAVCIAPCHVRSAAAWLRDSDVAVCTVVGFPLGTNHTALKAFEAERAVREGATEIDMVINIGWLKDSHYRKVEQDVRAVVDRVRDLTGIRVAIKAILETAVLTNEEKVIGSLVAEYAGANFIKTSTGFGGGSTVSDVALIRRTLESGTGVKASGGIATFEQADAMIRYGATRIGTSRSLDLIRQ